MSEFPPEVQVEDGEDFRAGSALGIREIALEQYRRCCIECSKEMVNGGTTTKIVRGVPQLVDIPNQREIFINSVSTMEIILGPEIIKNAEIVKKLRFRTDRINKEKSIMHAKEQALIVKYNQSLKNRQSDSIVDIDGATTNIKDTYEMFIVKINKEKLTISKF